MSVNIFEQASRRKLRFDIGKGLATVEDLWELKQEDLNRLYQGVRERIKNESQDSLMDQPSKTLEELRLKEEILTYVFKTRKDEAAKASARQADLAQLRFLRDLADRKRQGEYENMSLDDLNKQIADMEARVSA